MRLATPLAAAASVAAIVAVSVAVSGGPRPPAPSAGLAGVPPYYLTLVSDGSSGSATTISVTVSASTAPASTGSPVLGTAGGQHAVIRDTMTGATVAVIRPPRPFDTFDYVTGAADDRTFVLAAQNLSGNSGLCDGTSLFLAQFDPADHGVTLTALPVPEIPATSRVDAIALSPDGTRLAVALEPGQHCSATAMLSPLRAPINAASAPEQVRVYSLPSGAVKIWQSAPQWDIDGSIAPNAMSWTWDGMLAFNYPGARGGRSGQGLWLLNTNARGGSLLAHSRFAVSAHVPSQAHVITSLPGRWVWESDGIVTPDGRTVVAPIERYPERPGITGAAVAEFAASTGAEFRDRWRDDLPTRNPFFVPYYSVAWSNSSGSVLVVAAPAARGKASSRSVYGALNVNRFTPIPGAPAPSRLVPYMNLTTLVF